MNTMTRRLCRFAPLLGFTGVALFTPSPVRADYYALLIGQTTNRVYSPLIGANQNHQTIFASNCNDVQAGLTNGNWAGYGTAGHLINLSNGAANNTSVVNALAQLNTAMAGDADARLFIYFAGHGGFMNNGNPETSLTARDEYILFDDTTNPGQGLIDDSWAVIRNGVPRANHILYFIDACYGGGMWGGGDEGDLNRVGSSAFIASTGENQTAPLFSSQTPLLVNALNAPNGRNRLITAVGLNNQVIVNTFFNGPRRDDISPGDYDTFNDEVFNAQSQSVYFSTGTSVDNTVFLEGVNANAAAPEPGSLLLLAGGIVPCILLRRRCHR